MTLPELLALAEKLRAAQRLATSPAAYATQREAAAARTYERLLDEAIEELSRTPDVRASTSIEEAP